VERPSSWTARQQVLSFVRRDTGQSQHVDLNAVINEFDKIISHTLTERTRLVLELCQEPLPVYLDPGQLELALLNLVRNATDAMSGSGTVIIRTAVHRSDAPTGRQTVEVSVSDTGTGMPPEGEPQRPFSQLNRGARGQAWDYGW
jgi:signal transduction histidine kinase